MDDRAILDPFKIADGDTTRIGENIGNHQNSSLMEDLVRFRSGRIIRRFDDEFRLNQRGGFGGELTTERRRNQEIALGRKQLFVRDCFRPRKTLDTVVGFGVLGQLRDIESLGVGTSPSHVSDRHDASSPFVQELGGERADISKSLQCDFLSL